MSAVGNGAESQSNHRFSLCSSWIFFLFFRASIWFYSVICRSCAFSSGRRAFVRQSPAGRRISERAQYFCLRCHRIGCFFSLLLLLALKFIFADSTSPLSSIFQRNCTFPYVVFQLYRVAVRSNLSKFRTYPRSTRPSYRRLLYPMTENFRFFPLYFANFHPTWLGSGSAPVTYLSKTTFIQTLSTRILKIKYVLSSLRMHT